MNSLSRPAILMLEADLPGREVLDAYQATVASQVWYDADGQTVRGLPPAEYFHNGLVEELEETTGEDRVHANYDRLGALMMLDSKAGRFDAGEVTDLAVRLHQKEFGDVSWYLANRLRVCRLSLGGVVEAGMQDRIREVLEAPKCPPEFMLEVEWYFPFVPYLGYTHQVIDASRAALEAPSESTYSRLSTAAGKLVISMAQLVQARLNTTYQAILDQNLAKIAARIANGTVFDKTGGDTR